MHVRRGIQQMQSFDGSKHPYDIETELRYTLQKPQPANTPPKQSASQPIQVASALGQPTIHPTQPRFFSQNGVVGVARG